LLALVPIVAAATQLCPPGEYAQYKDKASGDIQSLAADYCSARIAVSSQLASQRRNMSAYMPLDFRGQDACMAEQKKMADAAAAVGKRDEFYARVAALCPAK
jgi:hypothetical protein